MPQRHSRNNTASAVFSYWEKGEAADGSSYGTQKVRVGADSQLAFGSCAQCLRKAVDPMATPSGHVYCRECIMEYLLAKTQALKQQKDAYEAQEAAKGLEKAEEGLREREEAAASFVAAQSVVANGAGGGGGGGGGGGRGSSASSAGGGKKRDREGGEAGGMSKEEAQGKITQRVVMRSHAQQMQELEKTSWWLPQFQPEHIEDEVAKPSKRPSSPMSGRPLRVKDLIPVTFTQDKSKEDKGSIICPVTLREINAQKAILIKKSGQVMLEEAVKMSLPTMTCPVTGVKFKSKDLVPLVTGGSSFSAAGRVESKKYFAALR